MFRPMALRAAPLRHLATASRSHSSAASQARKLLAACQSSPRQLSKPLANTPSLLKSASLATSAEAVAPAPAPARTPAGAPAGDQSHFDAITTGGVAYPGIPTFEDPYKKRQWQLEHMAGVFRIFARKGYTEGAAGHISVRDPVDPSTFWINPMGVHFGMLKASDMVHVDAQGQIIGGNRAAINAAGFMIHSAIHRARPDINAACHTHSTFGKAWSTFGRPLEMISQDACMLYTNQSVYSSFGGVVLAAEEGDNIARALGPDSRTVILQNHGLLTVGGTVDEAGYLYCLMERLCEIQLLVEATGLPKVYIGHEEAKFTYEFEANPETLYTEAQPDFEYEVWKSQGELTKGL